MLPTRILVTLDGSELAEGALPEASAISRQAGWPLALLTVTERLESRPTDEAYLADLAKQWGAAETVVAYGHPVDGILSEQARVPGTLVAMSTHGRSAIGEELMGSVAQAVLVRSLQPVLVHKPAQAPPTLVKRVVLPIDGTTFSMRIVDDVARFAAAMGASMDLIQVRDGPTGFVLREADVSEEGLARRLAGELRERHHLNVGWDILHSNHPGEAIAHYAAERDGSLIALASHSRGGVDRLLHGSVAATCIRLAGQPVLVYGPQVSVSSEMPAGMSGRRG